MLLKYHVPASQDDTSVRGVISTQMEDGVVNANAGVVDAKGDVVDIEVPDGTNGRVWVNYLDAVGGSSRNLHCVEWKADMKSPATLKPEGHKAEPIKAIEPKKADHSDHKKENTKV
jgi:hypothetical protein